MITQLMRHYDQPSGHPVVTQDRWRDRAIWLALDRAKEHRVKAVTTIRFIDSQRNLAAADAIDSLVRELQEL